MNIQPVKGMRDFYPEEMEKRNWLFTKFRDSARRFNYREYEPSILEHEEIYIRKAGEEITDQLYNFEDKGGRRVSLRPELTPSLARLILARGSEYSLPIRWFSIPQCFRYEKMQKGRKREHFQWNMDVVGEPGIVAEVELMAVLADFFESVGLSSDDVRINFNNRKILSEVLSRAGLPDERFAEVSVIIDKREKIGDRAVSEILGEIGVESGVIDTVIGFVNAPDLTGVESCLGYMPEAAGEIDEIVAKGSMYGIGDYLRFSPSLIRGLAYYTGTVFEAFDVSGSQRAICGGGRYDRLLSTFGGKDLPMAGFGFGDVVISLILEEKGLFPESFHTGPKVLVTAFSSGEDAAAISAARRLRSANLPVELDLSYRKLKKLFSKADKEGFSHVVVAAPDEVKAGNVSVKNLKTGSQEAVALRAVADSVTGAV
jgi:histidyl-tRNA synthetase